MNEHERIMALLYGSWQMLTDAMKKANDSTLDRWMVPYVAKVAQDLKLLRDKLEAEV